MGAKLLGSRKMLNDNRAPFKGALNEVPIPDEAFRLAPTIEAEPGKFWFCLVTVPQGEYRCADKLADYHNDAGDPMPVATYVPTDTRWTLRMKGRDRLRVQVQSPVFRGYVLAKLTRPKLVDRGGGQELSCEDDWTPILERDRERKSPHGILGVISYHGQPLTMPLHVPEVRNGVADIAEDERDGYFDDRRRPALLAARNAKPMPTIVKGDEVTPNTGPFAGTTFIAENDNDERGYVKLRSTLFGGAAVSVMRLEDLNNLTRPQNNVADGLRRA